MIPPKSMKMPINVFNVAFDLLVTRKVNPEDLNKLTPKEIEEYDFIRVLINSDLSDSAIEIAIEDLLYKDEGNGN